MRKRILRVTYIILASLYAVTCATAQLVVPNGTIINMSNGASLILSGNLSNSGTITGAGTILLTGASLQSVSGTGDISNMTVNNAAGAAINSGTGNNQNIYGTLVVSNGNLATGDNLTLKSDINGTARVGNSAGSITGYATVERYISNPGHRSWHLLSTNTYGSGQTIKQAWQENGGAIVNGVGTLVTSNIYTATNGYDMTSISSSILTHNQGGLSGPSWNYLLPNTNSTAWSSYPGYMLFVRGDRNYTPANVPATNATMLRSKGSLYQGTQPAVTVSATGPGRTLVGNPFASAIDLETIFSTVSSLDQNFYIWDPALTGNYGVGGFRIVQRNGTNSYTATPSLGANDNTLRYIQSGEAFFLKASGSSANVIFNENSKSNGLTVVNPVVSLQNDEQIITNLVIVNPGNIESLADGLRVRFDDSYSASLDDDIEKMGNFGENISSYRFGKKLIVEQRPMIINKDTIYLRLSNTDIKNYRLQINTQNFIQNNVNAWLQDNFLHTNTALLLDGSINSIDFSITGDTASANPGRFRIVFALSGPLPLTFTGINAYRQNADIAVEWKVSNQYNITGYEVERSIDGLNFTRAAIQMAYGINGIDAAYKWLDVNPVAGNNYYRIRSIGTGGEFKYSSIVKVMIGKLGTAIDVYPNPVTEGKINIQFTEMNKGIYQLRLIDAIGRVMFTKQLTHTGGSAVQTVGLGNIAGGQYQLEIIQPGNTRVMKALFIAN